MNFANKGWSFEWCRWSGSVANEREKKWLYRGKDQEMMMMMIDAYEDRKIIQWCRKETSIHSMQNPVCDSIESVGVCTALPDRFAVLGSGVDWG
ncbi:unnamed protein product [Clavelina lepadiformis]|uniref:Uncharacterized protein n=1 Tax=Clavelina lepadiformis TaxID=159417 RepID=A0ABP0EVD8_CLALP